VKGPAKKTKVREARKKWVRQNGGIEKKSSLIPSSRVAEGQSNRAQKKTPNDKKVQAGNNEGESQDLETKEIALHWENKDTTGARGRQQNNGNSTE